MGMSKQRFLSIFIAMIALAVMGSCAAVDRGLYDVGNSISSVNRVTGQRNLNFYSRPAQINQGNQATEQFLQQNYVSKGKKINADLDAKQFARLQTIFNRVHSVSHMKDEKWQVVLIPEDSFNAFVTGGTYVVVHQGLMNSAQSDDEIAAVMGHEIAHVAADHVFQTQSHSIGAALAGSKSVGRDSFQAAFSHENESEADSVGLLYAALAGYDPMAAVTLWERMGRQQGIFGVRFRSHPVSTERAAMNKELARIYRAYYSKGKINPDHVAILRDNPVFGYRETQGTAGEGGGLMALLETTAVAFQNQNRAKAEAQRQAQSIELIRYVQANTRVLERRVQEGGIVAVFEYNGQYPLSLISMGASIGKHKTFYQHRAKIQRGSRIVVGFRFDDYVPQEADLRQVQFVVDHAEQ